MLCPRLIAMGQVRHAKRQTINPLTGIRSPSHAGAKTLRILQSIPAASPADFLEATPLTSFVVMSLVHAPRTEESEAAIHAGARFLVNSVRDDGSWPIDTNLATWVSTLATNALHVDRDFSIRRKRALKNCSTGFCDQQHRVEHAYTHAAHRRMGLDRSERRRPRRRRHRRSIARAASSRSRRSAQQIRRRGGIRWLLDLQNGDGGIPTFCRGWTNLPFDRSGPDLTAHALLAWRAWEGELSLSSAVKIRGRLGQSTEISRKVAEPDGILESAVVWKSGQPSTTRIRPTAHRKCSLRFKNAARKRGMIGLLRPRTPTAAGAARPEWSRRSKKPHLALNALAANSDKISDAIERGTNWLINRIQSNDMDASPIGFYFAKLWYFEKLYPLIFTVSALSQG